jgi:hypothetical protein
LVLETNERAQCFISHTRGYAIFQPRYGANPFFDGLNNAVLLESDYADFEHRCSALFRFLNVTTAVKCGKNADCTANTASF